MGISAIERTVFYSFIESKESLTQRIKGLNFIIVSDLPDKGCQRVIIKALPNLYTIKRCYLIFFLMKRQ
ncbi:hypothetical protein D3C80_991390 [compost metagenome]